MWCARLVVPLFCRLRVTGDIPAELRGRSFILASNHIGTFDPIALSAVCARLGVSPRILATGGLFRAPVVGAVMRRCGHVRVDRRQSSVTETLGASVDAVREGSVVAGYPEGGITLDPGMWPERGRTGIARLALATGAPVVPVSQWGAHEVLTWVSASAMAGRLFRSLFRRPVVKICFGPPVDLAGLVADTPGHARQATDRIMVAITAGLQPMRRDEPALPRYIDPTRPVSVARSRVRPGQSARA
ncbi:MAG: 1-acyl-sn-glycerol-3-phosphate acyltransferase [Micromonosporaceae bacterium]|nr:1-acyl-sn-glycerol-3-phosphate acyltransferase [Micromonosporaceae bacterium]